MNKDLEECRSILWEAIEKLTDFVATYTFSDGFNVEDTWMKIPRYDGEYEERRDQRFFKQADELNAAAEDVWSGYKELIRKARLTLALGDVSGGDE